MITFFLASLAWVTIGFLLTIYLVKRHNFDPGSNYEPPVLLVVVIWPVFAAVAIVASINKCLTNFLLSLKR